MTKNFIYSAVIDDYVVKIFDESSLLEAIYYQLHLVNFHNLNWDAIQEGLSDAVKNYQDFGGVCLLFRNGKTLTQTLPFQFEVLTRTIQEVNEVNVKAIRILLT